MLDIQNINGYGLDGGTLAQLKEIAQKYCPEEAQEIRQSIFPDESLNLAELEAGFQQLLAGGSGYEDLPYLGDTETKGHTIPHDDGFGIGIPETQKLRELNYEELDTLNSEEIKKDFPVLNQR